MNNDPIDKTFDYHYLFFYEKQSPITQAVTTLYI